jgi:hypothetical protein
MLTMRVHDSSRRWVDVDRLGERNSERLCPWKRWVQFDGVPYAFECDLPTK